MITWGTHNRGGDSSVDSHMQDVASRIESGVIDIFSVSQSFAALKDDGSVVTWGRWGGDSSSAADQLQSGVIYISDKFYELNPTYDPGLSTQALAEGQSDTDDCASH